ncbi:autoinducer binding domain-containing protein [Sphingoaurantiacus capsulatus]|uniref:Autoinducer binding domain-containing protein n=1 Tax=Sphingoaurantiacus capsulatus TaxID=1771310 RepID=A0ABV7XG67_9SPHN
MARLGERRGGTSAFGELLRGWRLARRLSQLELAMRADLSGRHLCFVETGRARASAPIVDRLAAALELEAGDHDALRVAAGLARQPSLADQAFAAALAVQGARNPEAMVEAAKPALAALGMPHFFFGTMGWRGFDAVDPGGFPRGWLQRYRAQEYAARDPLLPAACTQRGGFFWEDAVEPQKLTGRASRMFREAAAEGIDSGFVLPLRGGDGSVRIVSMMGRRDAEQPDVQRLGLQLVGQQMVERLTATGYLPAA